MFPLCVTVWDEMGSCICSINDQVSIKISYLHSQLPNQGLHVSGLLHLSRAFGYFSLSQYASVLFPDQRWKKHMYLLLWVFLSASWVPKPKPTSYWRSCIFIYLKRLLSEWSRGSVQFSHSVMSDSLQPHGLQHTRLPCPSPTPGACSNSCSSSWWCHPTISSSVIPFSCLQSFPVSGAFFSESVLCIRWPKYWSFSFSTSPSNEYSGLISFRMDWLDLLAVQGTLKSLLQHHSSKASILRQRYFPHSPLGKASLGDCYLIEK